MSFLFVGGSVAKYAKQVVLPIVDDQTCQNYWRVSPVSRICAGELRQQKGICPVSIPPKGKMIIHVVFIGAHFGGL